MRGFSEHLFARLLKVVPQYAASQTNLHAKWLCKLLQRSCRSADRLELVLAIANLPPHLFHNSCLYYYIYFFLRLPFTEVFFAFRAAHSKCLLAECFVAYCYGMFCQHQGCFVLDSLLEKNKSQGHDNNGSEFSWHI